MIWGLVSFAGQLHAANVSVTAATGGGLISADTRGGAFTSLSGPVLKEGDKTGFGVGSIILNTPAGFEFDTNAAVRVAVSGRGKGSDLVLSNATAVVTTNAIRIDVASPSISNQRRSTLTWSGIKVRPTVSHPAGLARGNITRSGTSSYTESGSIGNYGALAEIPGAPAKLIVTLPNQAFTAGSGVTGVPPEVIAGTAFNLNGITAADQYLNIATNYNGGKTISYSGPGGSPSFTSSVTFTNGVSTNVLTTVLHKAEAVSITAGDGLISGPASSLLTIRSGGFAKLLLLLPGETATPGTLTGKSGTPVVQSAGLVFTAAVFAVDNNWNPVTNVTDTLSVTLSDTNATPLARIVLSGGGGMIPVIMPTAGIQTVMVADVTSPSIPAVSSEPVTVNPSTAAQLQVLLPGEAAAPGTITGKTGSPAAQIAGAAFTVRVYSVDACWNIAPSSDFVHLGSSDPNASMPPNAALSNGMQLLSVTLNSIGTSVFTATDLSSSGVTNGSSSTVTVSAGKFTQLQLLAPGETAAPGTPSGKTGIPLPHSAGVAFPMVVNAVDADWNVVNTVTDTLHFTSSDGLAVLPGNAPLVGGTGVFSVSLSSEGSQTVTVSDVSDGTRLASTSAVIRVGVADVYPATGGASMSADTTGGAFTPLTGPAIAEGSAGNIGSGTLILSVPAGFVINTGNVVMVTVSGAGEGSDVVLASSTATVSSTSIQVTVNTPSSSNRASTLTWSGIQVRPSSGTPLAGGHLYRSGTAILSGVPSESDFGLLTELAGTSSRLTVQTQPSSAASAGTVFAQQPVITIEDQFGNVQSTDNSTVISASRGAGSGVLQGTLSALAVNGVASFANLSHLVSGTITVSFSTPGLSGATSGDIVVSPASASLLTFLHPPSDTGAGDVISPAVTLQVKDAYGNTVSTSGVPVTIILNSGTGLLGGTTTNLTDASGLATFNNLTMEQAGVKKLEANASGLASVTSGVFTIYPAAASRLKFLQQPSDAVAGSPLSPAITVKLEDVFGNTVTNSGVPVYLSLSTGGGTLQGTISGTTGPGGSAEFSDLMMTAAGAKALMASSTGLLSTVSSVFIIMPADYTRVQLLVPGETAAPGTITGKTGIPLLQAEGVAFTTTVNAVDNYWNVIGTITNMVDLYSSDTRATLPSALALSGGTTTLVAKFNTGGLQTLSAEDISNLNIDDDTSPDITVTRNTFTLQVISPHGYATPAPGLYTNTLEMTLTNSVTGTDTQGSTQYVCTGWVMTGNAPLSGSSNICVMTVTNDSILTWVWSTNFLFTASAGPNGSISGSSTGWCAFGSSVAVTATPAAYYHFTGWSGSVQGDTNATLMTVTMDSPRSILASFAESVTVLGTPYSWYAQYNITNSNFDLADTIDADSDLMPNWAEYVAGTDPTNAASVFRITTFSGVTGPATVSCQSVTGRVYGMLYATNLVGGAWSPVTGASITGTSAVIVLTDTNAIPRRYYRLSVQKL